VPPPCVRCGLQVGVIYGSPEITSGGNALKFYASVRLDTRRKEILPDNKGIRIKVKVVKNKVAAPFKAVMLDVLFGTGIDGIGCTLDAALDLEVVQRRGSWYSYQGKQLAQGRHNAIDLLKGNSDLADQLMSDVRMALASFGKEVEPKKAAASSAVDEDEEEYEYEGEDETDLTASKPEGAQTFLE